MVKEHLSFYTNVLEFCVRWILCCPCIILSGSMSKMEKWRKKFNLPITIHHGIENANMIVLGIFFCMYLIHFLCIKDNNCWKLELRLSSFHQIFQVVRFLMTLNLSMEELEDGKVINVTTGIAKSLVIILNFLVAWTLCSMSD